MKAIVFEDVLRYAHDYPQPYPLPGWARIAVRLSGVCRTDLEILKGYMGFHGVLGHEFVGTVDQCEDAAWLGRRVVGDINAACGRCDWCEKGLGRHCPNRRTLGIDRLDGCMAEFCVLPTENLHQVPADVPDERAVFAEPLSAACEILDQIDLKGNERVIVLGDGRLGILCAWVLATVVSDATLVGHHPDKLNLAGWGGLRTALADDAGIVAGGADIVVEATGSEKGLAEAIRLCRPRGTVVLKSTVALQTGVNLSSVVVQEQTLVGSRCGLLQKGLAKMSDFPDMPLERLITACYAIDRADAAFARAQEGEALKILFDMRSKAPMTA